MTARVSIGLPVYNGGRFVARAIESILAQSFTDFELIVSDNGSTDDTESICRSFAADDSRIRYLREEENRGATWNFNRVFRVAGGEYFRWAAHDDVVADDHLEACVAVLDHQPDVVLCCTRVGLIDEDEQELDVADDFPPELTSAAAHERFEALLAGRKCYEIFGLIRSDALREIPPLGAYGHADGVLLARIGLLGPFHQVPEVLFHERVHAGQSMNVYGRHSTQGAEADGPPDYVRYAYWFDPGRAGRRVFPYWRLTVENFRSAITLGDLSPTERLRCLPALLRGVRHGRHWLWRDLKAGLHARVPEGVT